MDKILLRDLRANGILGIYPQERTTPQAILLNVTLYTPTRPPNTPDEISHCVDYENAAHLLQNAAQTLHRQTAEALAEDLATLCLNLPGVLGVKIRVEKPNAIPFTAAVGVEIQRGKTEE